MPNYKNGKIYKLWSPEGDDIYIGSTTQPLTYRKSSHKKRFLNGDNITSKIIFEKYNDVRIELLECVECETKEELIKKEGEYIRNNICVNKVIPDRKAPEYYQDNKEKVDVKNKEWNKNNPEKTKEHALNYYYKNREKINEESKTRNKQRITCECGLETSYGNKERHSRTNRHITLMNKINNIILL